MCQLRYILPVVLLVTSVPPATAQSRVLAGRVLDAATGQPIGHGEIRVKGEAERDRLRPDGVFVLHVRSGPLTLIVRGEGYYQREIKVAAYRQTLEITLSPRPVPAVSLSGEELSWVPAQGVEQALQGKLAGLDVTTNSGAPGDLQLRFRGVTTILGNSQPLWVVDGVIISDRGPASGVAALTGAPQRLPSRIADLNPHDIESIEVLRGAAAAAMYGSRGGSGVVIVRTKRGGHRR